MWRSLLLALGVLSLASPVAAVPPPRTPIILDTDIGSEIDDALALALVAASPELELVGVTTVASDAEIRAKMVLRFLHAVGMAQVPVAFGAEPQPKSPITSQYPYYYHPAVLYGRAGKPQKQSAVEFLNEQLAKRPGEITIVAVGPLTNIARLLKEHPDSAKAIKQLVIMGGALNVDYDGQQKACAEWNFKTDIAAAKSVLESKVPITLVPLDATWNLRLEAADRQKLFDKHSLLTMQVEALYQMWNQETPVLFDPLAVALVVDPKLAEYERGRVTIGDDGLTKVVTGEPNVRWAKNIDRRKFVEWYVDRVGTFGDTKLPRALKNPTQLITDDKFPQRVHTFEDYETDIEKRWWLSGRLETKSVPPGSKRAFRSQLTLDFDDLQGQLDTMYNAVVFNPVPGPPMGERTRLKFRYLLHGTDELRVQLYSLSNGYHRYLSLRGLKTDEWQSATVDMTAMRRPDGSGGALAKDERIDDIQFYVDPRASVLIDDVMLYDGATDGEQRPFPQRVLFTGWFDTGKQGVEWPGKFEIVPHTAPRTWKCAKSIAKAGAAPELVVSLRGQRPLGKIVELQFQYKLTGADALPIALASSQSGVELKTTLAKASLGEWSTGHVSWNLTPEQQKSLPTADELRFTLPPAAELLIDDVLLYEPGK